MAGKRRARGGRREPNAHAVKMGKCLRSKKGGKQTNKMKVCAAEIRRGKW